MNDRLVNLPRDRNLGDEAARRTRRRAFVSRAAFVLALLAAAFAGYQQVFSVIAPYDDEGYVMMSVAQYLRGLTLYEDVYTQYGPGLFAVEGGFHRLTGLPITHDVVRLRTLFLWLLTALAAGGVVRRITGARGAGAVAFVLAFLHLERFCLEPGHPQEICALLMFGAVLLAAFLPNHTQRAWVALGLGAAVGLVMMTKLNLGVFLLTGVILALIAWGPNGRWRRLAQGGVFAAACFLVFAVTWSQWDARGCRLPLTVLAGLAGFYLVTRGGPHSDRGEASIDRPTLSFSTWARVSGIFLAGVGVSCGALAVLMLGRGVSLSTLWHGLVGQHRNFADAFYHPAPLHEFAVALAGIGVAAAWWSRREPSHVHKAAQGVVAFFVAAVMLRYVVETTTPLVHGLNDRGGAGLLVAFVTPLAWVIIDPRRRTQRASDVRADRCDLGRLALCAVAVLQPLGAFPTPGTQMAVGSLPLLLVCLVALHDLACATVSEATQQASGKRLPHALTIALLLAVGVTLAWRDVWLYRYRDSLTPLELRGASRLRVPAEIAAEQQWLVAHLRDNASTFVFGEHARNSVYFWAELEPPTALNATVWPYLLRPEQQRRIVSALRAHSRICLVRETYAASPPSGEQPLAAYLTKDFQFQDDFGRFQVFGAAHSP